jgi:hypothetical protein
MKKFSVLKRVLFYAKIRDCNLLINRTNNRRIYAVTNELLELEIQIL